MLQQSSFRMLRMRPRSSDERIQRMQAWARIGFALAGLVYLAWHAPHFSTPYGRAFIAVATGYFLLQALSFRWIRKKRWSLRRMLLLPIFDIFVVAYGILLDDGIRSGIYLVFFVIIFGNAFRYGKGMMLYAQALSLFAMICIAVLQRAIGWPIDWTLFAWELSALAVLPLYVQRILERAEEIALAREKAESALNRLMRHGPLALFTYILDEENTPRVRFANEAALALCGRTIEELAGETPDLFVAPEDGAEFNEFCRRAVLEGGHIETMDIRGRQLVHGKPQQLLCAAISLPLEEGSMGACYLIDITERELLREAIFEAEHYAQLLAALRGIVHDYRNVLTSIVGQAEILRLEASAEEVPQLAEEIATAAERGGELLAHLMRRLRGIKTKKANRPLSRKEIEHLLSLVRVQLPARAELIAEIEEPLPQPAASTLEVEQILLNLLTNAAQAIREEGRIELALRAARKEDKPMLEIVVADDGIGIPPEDQPHIFDPFWTTHAEEGGTGLGLASVQAIVQRHRGIIELDSAPGKGTRFRILLPAEQEAKPMPSTARQAEPTKTPRPAQAIVVEDRDDVRTAICQMLKTLGVRTVLAMRDGEEAFAHIARAPGSFELLITDYRMPRRNGLALIEAVRAPRPELPIILLTAYADSPELSQAAKRLHALVVAKPVRKEHLQAAIAEAYALVAAAKSARAEKSR